MLLLWASVLMIPTLIWKEKKQNLSFLPLLSRNYSGDSVTLPAYITSAVFSPICDNLETGTEPHAVVHVTLVPHINSYLSTFPK